MRSLSSIEGGHTATSFKSRRKTHKRPGASRPPRKDKTKFFAKITHIDCLGDGSAQRRQQAGPFPTKFGQAEMLHRQGIANSNKMNWPVKLSQR